MTTPTTPTTSPAEAYETYFGPAIFAPLASHTLAYAAPRPGESVLDVACGTGIVTRRAARLVGGDAAVVGVDINPAMVEVARSIADGDGAAIDYRHGDASQLDLPDGAFDLALCQQGLQFLDDRRAGAVEMRRVLRDGGRAVVAVWQGPELHPLYTALAEAEVPQLARFGVPVSHDEAMAPFTLGDPEELADILTDAGFRQVAIAQETIVARFPDADRYVERMEHAYAAVVPQFLEDPEAFTAYLAAIDRETRAIVDTHRDGDHVVVPMHANIAVAST